MSNQLIAKFAERFSVDPAEVATTLKNTCFKGANGSSVTDAQMTALMIVADQYGLNPFTKEIYAYPDKNNGIVPVVGVDGWSRIINSHPMFDGLEFDFDEDKQSSTCSIYRKDRSKATRITEYMNECKRPSTPWQSHPRRMLRHKSLIQCARLAFGFVGIYDADEAERIMEAKDINSRPQKFDEGMTTIDNNTGEIVNSPKEPKKLPPYSESSFETNLPAWQKLVDSGKTPYDIVAMILTKFTLSDSQAKQIYALKKQEVELSAEANDFVSAMESAEKEG